MGYQNCILKPPMAVNSFIDLAGVAQQAEHLTCNEDVAGSIPVSGSEGPIEVGLSLLRTGRGFKSRPRLRLW